MVWLTNRLAAAGGGGGERGSKAIVPSVESNQVPAARVSAAIAAKSCRRAVCQLLARERARGAAAKKHRRMRRIELDKVAAGAQSRRVHTRECRGKC